jgi:hypothetical protein
MAENFLSTVGTNIGNLFKATSRAYDTPNYEEMKFLEGRFQQENQEKLSQYDDYVSAVTNLTERALAQARNNKPIDVPQYYKNTFGTTAESEFKKDVNKLNKERELTTSFGNAAVSPEYIAKFLGQEKFTNFLNDVDLSRNVLGSTTISIFSHILSNQLKNLYKNLSIISNS